MAAKILLISDDRDFLKIFYQNLHALGYQVFIAVDDNNAITICSIEHPDIIILNLHFSKYDLDEIKFSRRIREAIHYPVIILFILEVEPDKMRALDAESNGSLDISLASDEVMTILRSLSRIRPDLTTNSLRKDSLIICGDLTINTDSREVTLLGKYIRLTHTEFDILKYLVEKNGSIVSYADLLKRIRGPEFKAQKEYIRVYISQLRHKIEPNPVKPSYILTEPGIGYRIRTY